MHINIFHTLSLSIQTCLWYTSTHTKVHIFIHTHIYISPRLYTSIFLHTQRGSERGLKEKEGTRETDRDRDTGELYKALQWNARILTNLLKASNWYLNIHMIWLLDPIINSNQIRSRIMFMYSMLTLISPLMYMFCIRDVTRDVNMYILGLMYSWLPVRLYSFSTHKT